MKNALLYFHTLKYLKPQQFIARLRHRVYSPGIPSSELLTLRALPGSFVCCERAPSMVSANEFILLNERRMHVGDGDWDLADWPLLWRYNLHYFDDLAATDAAQRADWHRTLIDRWIQGNPPASGTGWDSYPVSLRIVNWVKFHLNTQGLDVDAQRSLAQQARHLRRRLEYHLLGNHLWANAKALVFAGCFFDAAEAERWLAHGLHLVQQQLAEQILEDGGHFELSPMYHAIVLEDLLDLIQLSSQYPKVISLELAREWRCVAARMLVWLQIMTHPDGAIAFFNDATNGIAPSLEALTRYAETLGVTSAREDSTSEYLKESGYVRAEAGAAVLLADLARIGPDYLPGHAHADTLSFELSLFGQRVIVNQGIDRYGQDEERLRQRGSAAHSTVVVDGQDSSEVWSGFRVARRAYPLNPSVREGGDATIISCGHNGYHRLPGHVTHYREWHLKPTQLRVTDTLNGRFGQASAWYHMHPDVSLLASSHTACELAIGEHRMQVRVEHGELLITDCVYLEGFGLRRKTFAMQILFAGNQSVVEFEWI